METAKQKAIREAYGEHWDFFKDHVNSDGWFKDYVLGQSESLSVWALSNCDKEFDSIGIEWRSTMLKGIETNNGWITIESEADLPISGGPYWCYCNEDVSICSYIPELNMWSSKNVTHYQPIEKPKPPIY